MQVKSLDKELSVKQIHKKLKAVIQEEVNEGDDEMEMELEKADSLFHLSNTLIE